MGKDFQKSALPTFLQFLRVRTTHLPHVSDSFHFIPNCLLYENGIKCENIIGKDFEVLLGTKTSSMAIYDCQRVTTVIV